MARWQRARRAFALACGLAVIVPAAARADQILVAPDPDSRGYVPVEELAHEWIVEPDAGGADGAALVRVRLALHNASAVTRDFVYLAALPVGAELQGLRTARGGVWRSHVEVSGVDPFSARVESPPPLDDFAAFAVPLARARMDAVDPAERLGGAQIFGWGLPSGETVQVELVLRVQGVLRGGRWSLDLPRRGEQSVLARTRRVLVRSPDGSAPRFWTDDRPASAVVETRSADGTTVAWPARSVRTQGLVARAEATTRAPDDPRGPGGSLRLLMQAGLQISRAPDHLSLALDTSSSVDPDLTSHGRTLLMALADATPSVRTLDALAFDRQVRPIFERPEGRETGLSALHRAAGAEEPRAAGSDVISAIEAAIERLPPSARRPTILVLSDGMFPAADPARLQALQRQLRATSRRSIRLVILVEDPTLGQRDLEATHPATEMAAELGARLRRVYVPDLRPEELPLLLDASPVLSRVRVRGGDRTEFASLPDALVGGQIERVDGTWRGRTPPRSLDVRALAGGRTLKTRVTVRQTRAPTGALLSAADDVDEDRLAASLVTPGWYERGMLEPFAVGLARAAFRAEGLEGTLTRPILGVYLRRHVMPRVRACYNRALARDPTLGGQALFTYQLGKGEVMRASVDVSELSGEDASLRRCLDEAAWSLQIPAGQRDATRYLVHYPIRLVPPENGQPRGEESELSPLVEMMLDGADILAR